MKSNNLRRSGPAKLLQDIYATTDNEIFCDTASDIITRCADLLYSDSEARTFYPQLFRHLRLCSNCADEYKVNMELARLEAAGQLERPPTIPPIPPRFLGSTPPVIATVFQKVIEYIFPGFSIATSTIAVRGKSVYTPVFMGFENRNIQVELQIQESNSLPDHHTLICKVTLSPDLPISWLDDAKIYLEQDDGDEVEQSVKLSKNKAAMFEEVVPGKYQMRFQFGNQIYLLRHIDTEHLG